VNPVRIGIGDIIVIRRNKMKRELKPWEWAEIDKYGNQCIFDGRLIMPIYDYDLDDPEYIKKTTEYWAKISEQYPCNFKIPRRKVTKHKNEAV
jgi:hypothetical protein